MLEVGVISIGYLEAVTAVRYHLEAQKKVEVTGKPFETAGLNERKWQLLYAPRTLSTFPEPGEDRVDGV